MSRFIAILLGLVCNTSILFAQPLSGPAATATASAPENLLSPTSQVYIRWDGITSHNNAYKKSIWGGVMAGPTGGSIRELFAQWPRSLGSVVTRPLLEGKHPAELKTTVADLKKAEGLIDVIAEKGLVISVEVKQPTPKLENVANSLRGLLTGELSGSDLLTPDLQVLVVVPDAAERADVLFASIRLILASSDIKVEPFKILDRTGFRVTHFKEAYSSTSVAWWVEGKHFVLSVGSIAIEKTIDAVKANTSKGGITAHPLLKQCCKNPGYESVARGFVETASLIALAKMLAGPLFPGLGQRIDDLGFGNLKSIVFNSGFEGKESRATYEFHLPGERKGFARILKQQSLGLQDLPPLPPDVTRFSALRIDPAAAYDAAIAAVEATIMNSDSAAEVDDDGPAEKIRLRREYLCKEADKLLGVNIKNALLPHLGDKLVIFNTPSEGFLTFGTVVCISVKDAAKLKAATDRIQRGLESYMGSPVKVRKRTLCGVEIRELHSVGFSITTPTYAIVGDWLVLSMHPQPVQGFVLRSKGEIPVWKPDAGTVARLARLPKDACGLQYCDPRATVQNLLCIGPIALNFLNASSNSSSSQDGDSNYEPIDLGLIPNAHELNKHLFPNLTVTRDDGKTIRIEVNESFSLPLEFIGLEPVAVGMGLLGLSLFN